jgi:D-beta-D-heptose 7-phosphate kinase/D-beta-D-heptose 1-phosphate adenosyltransferase
MNPIPPYRKTVVVSGGFDPCHEGHIEYIRLARSLGTHLVVVVSRDEQLISKKGYCSLPLKTRMAVVANLKGVDEVVVNCDPDETCAKSILKVCPEVFAKGGDRNLDNLPQSEIDACFQINCEIVCGLGEKINSSSSLAKGSPSFNLAHKS